MSGLLLWSPGKFLELFVADNSKDSTGICWSFNWTGTWWSGVDDKKVRERKRFMRKAKKALFLELTLLHIGTGRPLEWVKAQCTFLRGS